VGAGWWAGDSRDHSRQRLEEALRALEGLEEPRLEVRLSLCMATELQRAGEADRALACVQGAVAAARGMSDLELLRTGVRQTASTLYWLGRYEESLVAAAEALEVGRSIGDPTVDVNLQLTRFCCLWDLGRLEAAMEAAQAARSLAVALGAPHPLALSHSAMGYVCQELGLFDEARHHHQAARRVAEQGGYAALACVSSCDLALVAHLRGDLADARQRLDVVIASDPERSSVFVAWWVLSLRIVLAATERDAVALRQASARLRAVLPQPMRSHQEHHARSADLAEAVLQALEGQDAALAPVLLAYADALRPEHGHEPRLLARLAREGAARQPDAPSRTGGPDPARSAAT
jgi:tetratricopeptide (TPR) repeat protein